MNTSNLSKINEGTSDMNRKQVDISSLVSFIQTKYPKVEFKPFTFQERRAIGFILSGGALVVGYINKSGHLCKLTDPIDLRSLSTKKLSQIVNSIPLVDGFDKNDKAELQRLFEGQQGMFLTGSNSERKQIQYELQKQINSTGASSDSPMTPDYKVLYDTANFEMMLLKTKYEGRIDQVVSQYQKLKDEFDNYKERLKVESKTLNDNLSTCRKEVKSLLENGEVSLSDVNEKMISLNKMTESIRSEKDVLQKRIENLSDIVSTKDTEITMLQKTVDELNTNLKAVTAELNKKLHDTRYKLCRDKFLKEKDAIIDGIKSYNKKWEEWTSLQKNDISKQRDTLNKEFQSIKQGLQKLRKHYKNETGLSTEINKVSKQLQETIDKLAQRDVELQQRNERLAEKQSELQKRDEQLAEKQSELQKRDERLAEKQSELQKSNERLQECGNEVQKRDERLAEKHSELQKRDEILQEQAKKLSQQQGETEQLKSLCADVERKDQALAGKDQALAGKEQVLASKEAEIKDSERKIAVKLQEIESKEHETEMKEQQIAEKTQLITQLEREITSKQQLLLAKEQELTSKKGDLEKTLQSQETVKSKEQELAQKEEQLSAKEKDIEAKNREVTQKEEQLSSKERDIVVLSGTHAQEIATKKNQLTAAESELKGKQDEIISKEKQLAAKEQQLATKDVDLQKQQQELATKDADLQKQQQQLATKDADLQKQQQELATKDADLQKQQQQLATKGQEQQQLAGKEQEQQAMINEKTNELDKKHNELQTKENDLEKKRNELQKRIEELERQRTTQNELIDDTSTNLNSEDSESDTESVQSVSDTESVQSVSDTESVQRESVQRESDTESVQRESVSQENEVKDTAPKFSDGFIDKDTAGDALGDPLSDSDAGGEVKETNISNKFSRSLTQRLAGMSISIDENEIIRNGDLNRALGIMMKKYNIIPLTKATVAPKDISSAIDILNSITNHQSTNSSHNSQSGGGAGGDTVNELLRTYVDTIFYLTSSPAMVKLTSLGLGELKDIILRKDIQIWYNSVEGTPKVMKKLATFVVLQLFLYIDITPLFIDKSNEIATFKKNYLRIIEDDITNDTSNFLSIVKGDSDSHYLYIKRFSDIVNSLLQNNAGGYVSYMKNILASYIVNTANLLYGFKRVYAFIENEINAQLQAQLNEVLTVKVKQNVLTYVKVRNDDGTSYNNRFKVFTNIDDSKFASENQTNLIVSYNDHNVPYYQNAGGKWVPNGDLKSQWVAGGYKEEHFSDYFSPRANELEVKKYDATYALGPFTHVFEHTVKNNEIAVQIPDVINSLLAKKPVFIIGYGASGSGKTSSLIYFNKGSDENSRNGILVHLCNIMGGTHGYKTIKVKAYEFLRKRNDKRTSKYMNPPNGSDIKFEFNGRNFVLSDEYQHTNRFVERVGSEKTTFAAGSLLGEVIIHLIDNDRFVKATTNNPNSSRSHTLIFIKFERESATQGGDTGSATANSSELPNTTTLIVGDFAGVENLFNCKDPEVISKFLSIKRDDGSNVRFYSDINSIGGNLSGGGRLQNCDMYTQKNEDLYVFSPSTPIRQVPDNDVNKKILNNPFFNKSDAYFGVQKGLAQLLLENDIPPSQIEYIDMFKILQSKFDSGKDLFTPQKEQVVNDSIKSSVSILQEFSKVLPVPGQTETEITKRKEQFFKFVIASNPDWTFLQDPTTFYSSSIVGKIEKMKNKAEAMGMVTQLNKSYPKLFQREITSDKKTQKVEGYQEKLKEHYRQRKKIIAALVSGNLGDISLDDQILFDYTITDAGLTPGKKISLNVFFQQFSNFFSNFIFNLIGVKVAPGPSVFLDTWNALMRFFGDTNSAVAFISEVDVIIPYIYNELHEILNETQCRLGHGDTVCNVRRNEGEMINNTLGDMREVIKRILIEKNKGSINISPAFIETCLQSYCTSTECFPFDKRSNQNVSSDIFDVIRTELLGENSNYTDLRNLIIGVFCVLNLSKKANNPPPVPYIDINNMWHLMNTNANLFDPASKFHKLSLALFDKLQTFGDKLKELLTSDTYINFKEIVDKVTSGDTIQDAEAEKLIVLDFLNTIDKINAASAIGTLQFVDSIAKYNTTNVICSEDLMANRMDRYIHFINNFVFLDVVKKTRLLKASIQ